MLLLRSCLFCLFYNNNIELYIMDDNGTKEEEEGTPPRIDTPDKDAWVQPTTMGKEEVDSRTLLPS